LTKEQVELAKQEPLNYIDNAYEIKTPHFVLLVQDQVTRMCQAGSSKLRARSLRQGCDAGRPTDTDDRRPGIAGYRPAHSRREHRGQRGPLRRPRWVAGGDAAGTGEILAYIGSRDYNRDDIAGKVDIATSLQSHGSTMKMFTYLTAFEQVGCPRHTSRMPPLSRGGRGQEAGQQLELQPPGQHHRAQAIAESVNTTAVRTVMEVGMDEMRDTAHRLGITDLRQATAADHHARACEVQLLDMTLAVSTLG